jgi:Cu(I)/Ag(I) efflux system periplasmic protein CusF
MKRSIVISTSVAAALFAASGWAQMQHGKEAKPMDMKDCKEMMASMGKGHMGTMGKGHMGMMSEDMPKECREMMEKQGMGMQGMQGAHGGMAGEKAAQAGQHEGVGVVKRVDAAGGKVTLEHDPIKSLGWPKMTMAFAVRDRKALESLKAGQQVNFGFVQQGSDYVITTIK